MNDFRRLFPFIRPYRLSLGISFVLLFGAGILEVLTTALAIPLFDKVLGSPTVPVSDGSLQKWALAMIGKGLSLLPGNVLMEVSI
ncbi:MAG: hypothetical protein ABSH28_03965, partial [Acidobacteriota bacterium]